MIRERQAARHAELGAVSAVQCQSLCGRVGKITIGT